MKEIKELKREIKEIVRKEEFWKELFPSLSDGIAIHYKGKILLCNEALAKMFGYTSEELVEKDIFSLAATSFRKKLKEKIDKGEEVEYEGTGLKKNGKTFIVKVRTKSINYKGGILRLVIVKDITREKEYLKKIKEPEEKQRVLVETSLDGILIIDSEGRIIFSNNASAEMFGFRNPEEVRGKSIFDFIDKDFIDKAKIYIKLVYENKGGFPFEYRVKDIKGNKFWVEAIGRKIYFKNKKANIICLRNITDKKIMEENLREAFNKSKKLLDQTIATLSSTLFVKDPYTVSHQKRVTKIVIEISKEIGFSNDITEGIKIASLLHDIGKITVPTEILSKPGKLSNLEMALIREHPIKGAEILKHIEFPWPVQEIILQHHERLDGSGYPKGLKDDEILIEAKILAVADVVEAMASDRPYRRAHGIDKALEEIEKNKGILYEPIVVDTCINIFKKGFSL